MKLSEFDYYLPKELIAQTPIEPRDHSKLLIIDTKNKQLEDKHFYDIIWEIWENDVLVLNKTKVINARLHGYIEGSPNNKLVEIFLHKQIWENTWDCLVYPGKKLKPGKKVTFGVPVPLLTAEIKEISEKWRIVEFNKWWLEFLEIINKLWEIPLPPYIKEKLDNPDRYQTIWAETSWSVAAPTASLHFTPELLEKLENAWVKIEKVLLHVGLWTFMPVETDEITKHKMHSEYIELEENVAKNLNKYKKEWKRIIAVWTTAIRVLETMSDNNWILKAWSKETDIFIYPGYKWKFVDAIITNFHLPKSTLLMLVSSFAGKDLITKAYKHAVEKKYRFFSFWDAMFIKNKK
jgi:S-adenosylmethionine:tRNA ribosyltransferase-isomerase